MLRTCILHIFCCLLFFGAAAQESVSMKERSIKDSVENVLKNTGQDSSKMRLLYSICAKLDKEHRYKEQLEISYLAIALADSLNYRQSRNLARIRLLMSSMLNDQVTDLDEALQQSMIVKAVADSLKDSMLLSRAYTNIGVSEVYIERDTSSAAYASYSKALTISERLNDIDQTMRINNLIGNIMLFRADTANAIKYYRNTIKYGRNRPQFNDLVAISLNNLGEIYFDKGKYDSAMVCYRSVQRLLQHSNKITQKAWVLRNIGIILLKKEATYKNGLDTLLLAAAKGLECNNPYYSRDITNDLYHIYKKQGDYKNALHWKELTDSLSGLVENAEIQQKFLSYQISSKVDNWKQSEKLTQAKKDALTKAKIERQQMLKNLALIALIAAMLLAFYILNRYRLISKQKQLIEQQKQEVDKAYRVVDNKNNDILASIRYASRIQNALLIPQENISSYFAEHFIFYRPRDIVSGDFYWSAQHDGKLFMATADCTGHGVPGAFMSLLGNSFLNEILLVRKIIKPDLILNELRKKVIEALNPKGSHEQSADGMDMVLCCFDPQRMQLNYAAANNPLWMIRKKSDGSIVFTESQYDKFPVGKFIGQDAPFRNFTINLCKGDAIYTFTDGYRDQFGGKKGKRMGKKGFRDLIMEIHHLPMQEQSARLASRLNEWMGSTNEQVDDICIMGIRI